MKNRVVITGYGSINALGHDVASTWQAVRAGRHGIAPITHYDATDRQVHLAAEIKNYNVNDYFPAKEGRRLDPYIAYALIAAKEAKVSVGEYEVDPYRIGTSISSGIGGLTTNEKEHERILPNGAYDRVTPFFIPMVINNMAAGHVSMMFGAQGSSHAVTSACASSTDAVGMAYRMVAHGYLDMMIVGGSEASITRLAMGGFSSMKALHRGDDPDRASIPFDKERSGFVMGEGATVLILENLEHALARKAHILCEIAGYGASADAYHITAPRPDGEAAAHAIRLALAEAGVTPEEIDYINAHGTSTPMNDELETLAIRKVFGERLPAVSSTKALTGHLLGGTGALEALLTGLALYEGQSIPQFGLKVRDEACDLPLSETPVPIRMALSNSLGFGGHNACLVMKKWEGADA